MLLGLLVGVLIFKGKYVPGLTRALLSYPFWLPLMPIIIVTVAVWWRERRRVPAGHCWNCRYDLTGNVSGVCPECGKAAFTRPGNTP